MLLLSISLVFIAVIQAQQPTTSSCIGAYGQCGGVVVGNRPYTGQTCCISGYVCTTISAQYSHCDSASNTPQTPTNPTPPSNPNTQIVTPVNPTDPQRPPAGTTPVTPQQPPATPQYPVTPQPPQQPVTPPYTPPQPGFGPFGGFMPGMMDPQYLNCEFGQCINRKITLTPGQGFVLNCKLAGQCNGLDLTLNVGHDPTNWGSGVNEINDLNFDAAQTGVTITINSMFAGNNIEVNNIYCKKVGACTNLKVNAGWGVELWNINVKCEMPGSCNGCTINGQSCEMISMMNGNNGGYMPYGYGYTNTPNQPQQPQAPGVSQQGMPQPQYPYFV